MKDQELFKQLHNLSKMKPDVVWKDSQRSIMLSQVNTSSTELKKTSLILGLLKMPLAYIQGFSQPVMATFILAFLLLTGGFAGLRVAQSTKPGDSLYLAKIVGEKTQLALAFTDKKKAELGIGFAVRRVKEMKQVIFEEPEGDSKDDKVEQLVEDFKKEISAAKIRIGKISEVDDEVDDIGNFAEKSEVEGALVDEEEALESVDDQVFSAGSSKADDGLQVSDNISDTPVVEIANNVAIVDSEEDTKDDTEATTTEELLDPTIEDPIIETASAESILQQASDLLQSEDYDGILNILDNAGEAVDQSYDTGEVQGEEESVEAEVSTSTKE